MRILDVDEISVSEARGLTPHLLEGEVVHAAFRSASAAVLFTERRIVVVARETLLAEKIETSSFSYRAVRQFATLEAHGEVRGEASRTALKIWLGTEPQPLQLRANAGTSLDSLQRLLASKLD